MIIWLDYTFLKSDIILTLQVKYYLDKLWSSLLTDFLQAVTYRALPFKITDDVFILAIPVVSFLFQSSYIVILKSDNILTVEVNLFIY